MTGETTILECDLTSAVPFWMTLICMVRISRKRISLTQFSIEQTSVRRISVTPNWSERISARLSFAMLVLAVPTSIERIFTAQTSQGQTLRGQISNEQYSFKRLWKGQDSREQKSTVSQLGI